jgi:hypothetical protein
VSACLFARVSKFGVAVPISVRGPNHELATDAEERAGLPVQEGAFYGNLFTPVDQPIEWIACRGDGQAAQNVGGLIDRDCAKPDPTNPGFTMCGFIFAGDCGTFAGAAPACEELSNHGGFYERCHAAPVDIRHPHGDSAHDPVFRQVITTYVTP